MGEIEKIQTDSSTFRVAVISDTHIPDRVNDLHPLLISKLQALKVDLIFHGGDIAVSSVLGQLEKVAPVRAVTGNRDFLLVNELPMTQEMEIYNSRVVLTHGHLSPRIYWQDKFTYITNGYDFERYKKRLERSFPEARVIVFGHTHHPENRWEGNQLYFNPGSVSHGDRWTELPSYGLLIFYDDGRIESSLIPLTGAVIRNKKWEKSI
jgi:putative phosphoesterase